MQLDRKLCRRLHGFDELLSLVWNQESCHVLDTDRISTHLLDVLCHLHPVFKCICITQCVRQSDLRLTAPLSLLDSICCIHSALQIPKIIKTVENTNDIDSVCNRFLNKLSNNVICIVAVAQNILTPEKHLQFRVFDPIPDLSESLPWIFLQEPE